MIEKIKQYIISKEWNIQQKLTFMLLTITVAAFLLSGATLIYSMLESREQVLDAGLDIITSSTVSSTEVVEAEIKYDMEHRAKDKAQQIDDYMMSLKLTLEIIAEEMHDIELRPQDYIPKPVSEASEVQPYTWGFYLQHGKDFNRAASEESIERVSMCRDFLLKLASIDPVIVSLGVASKHNFVISADNFLEGFTEEDHPKEIYEVTAAGWYKRAVSEGKTVYSDIKDFNAGRGGTVSTPYYGANGEIEGVVCLQYFTNELDKFMESLKMYSTGFCFILDNRGCVISDSQDDLIPELEPDLNTDVRESKNKELQEIAKEMVEGKSGIGEVTFNGQPYYIAYEPLKETGWSFGLLLNKEEIVKPVIKNRDAIERATIDNIDKLTGQMFHKLLILMLLMVGMFVLIGYLSKSLSGLFVKPIRELRESVKEVAEGNFDKKVELRTGDELEDLADSFNDMQSELKEYMANLTKVTADKERIATELNVARNIQLSMLPRDFDFNRDDFEIYATMNAAKEVGGDFYDFYLLDEKHLMITIADVSGKGVPAALFMANSKTILKNFAMTMTSPDDLGAVMKLANEQLCQGNDEMMFVTVFMGLLDLETGRFIYVSGGHNPPLVYHKSSDKFEYMQIKNNILLGMLEDRNFTQQELQLQAGDMLYLYTDGVNEAIDLNNKQYGEDRLLECLNKANKKDSLESLLQTVREDISKFVGEAEQSDDITMLAVKLLRI